MAAAGATPVPARKVGKERVGVQGAGSSAYGTESLQGASQLARAVAGPRRSPLQLFRALPHLPATVRFVRSLPVVDVRLSSDRQGQAIRHHLGRRRPGLPVGRLGAAVLELPPTLPEYLRGKRRQALRTNVSRARELGVTARRLDDEPERRHALTEVFASRGTREPGRLAAVVEHALGRSDEVHAAFVADGRCLAFAGAAFDVEWTHVTQFYAVRDDEAAPYARYLLHLHLVEGCLSRGVRAMCFESALTISPGLQHLQRLLGFEPVRLRLLDEAPQTRQP